MARLRTRRRRLPHPRPCANTCTSACSRIPPSAPEPQSERLLRVHVRPGARGERVSVTGDGALLVATRARAVEGRANEAVRRLVAHAAGVPLRDVLLVHGGRSRTKLLQIANLTPQEALANVERNIQ
ncbi:DUF167 domain-containing protein [bacterium]|nr:MAG: DUF167 domain-containing protein [bacterium]